MNDRDWNADLRRRFQELRRSDRGMTPPFTEITVAIQGRGAPQSLRPWAVPVGLAAAAAVVGGLWLLGDGGGAASTEPLAIDLSATRWTAPTDFLLELPGNALLRQVPELETGAAWLSWDDAARIPDPPRRELRDRS